MKPDHIRTELDLVNDARLLTAVAPVVEFAGRHAGLADEAALHLAAAAELACRKAFPLVNGSGTTIHFSVEEFDDRVEVRLDFPVPHSLRKTQPMPLVDRSQRNKRFVDHVRFRLRAGHAHLTLTKDLP